MYIYINVLTVILVNSRLKNSYVKNKDFSIIVICFIIDVNLVLEFLAKCTFFLSFLKIYIINNNSKITNII